jgi:pyruvate dehydrogenase E1 component alpha subunit
MTKHELITFENDIKHMFEEGKIRAPIHLSCNNEDILIEIFNGINPDDWVFSTHRNHYHALLCGINPERLKKEILEGNSMHICNREAKFISSSIVGSCLPVAIGVAMGIKMNRDNNKVWVFVGDMAAEMGVFHECTKYAARHLLPITFIVEDNGLSTDTPTQEVWGEYWTDSDIMRYEYVRDYPHVGTGKWVTF